MKSFLLVKEKCSVNVTMAKQTGKRFCSIIYLILFSLVAFINLVNAVPAVPLEHKDSKDDKATSNSQETEKIRSNCSFPPKGFMYGEDSSDSSKAPNLCTNSPENPSRFVVEGCKLIYNFTEEICSNNSLRNFKSPKVLSQSITEVCQTIQKNVENAMNASLQPPVLLKDLAEGGCQYLCSVSENYTKICKLLLLGFQISLDPEQKLKSNGAVPNAVVTPSPSEDTGSKTVKNNMSENKGDEPEEPKDKSQAADVKTDDQSKKHEQKTTNMRHGTDLPNNNDSSAKANNLPNGNKLIQVTTLKPEKPTTKNTEGNLGENGKEKVSSDQKINFLGIGSVDVPGKIPSIENTKLASHEEAKHPLSIKPETQKTETQELEIQKPAQHPETTEKKDEKEMNAESQDISNNRNDSSKKADVIKETNSGKNDEKQNIEEGKKEMTSTNEKDVMPQLNKNPVESTAAPGTTEASENVGGKLNSKDMTNDQFLPADNAKKEDLPEKLDNKETPGSPKIDTKDDNEKDDVYGVNESENDVGDDDDDLQLENQASKQQGQEESATTSKKGFSKASGGMNPVAVEFPEYTDSHFFTYFLTVIVLCIVVYLVFHNKQKIIALIIEGRHEQRRRPNTTNYKKLDSNLEEMMQGGKKDTSSTHIIF